MCYQFGFSLYSLFRTYIVCVGNFEIGESKRLLVLYTLFVHSVFIYLAPINFRKKLFLNTVDDSSSMLRKRREEEEEANNRDY